MLINKRASDLTQSASTITGGAIDIIRFLTSLNVLKTVAIGGGAGWLAAKLTSPKATDKANVRKQYQVAQSNDTLNKLRARYANQLADAEAQREAPKSMRLT